MCSTRFSHQLFSILSTPSVLALRQDWRYIKSIGQLVGWKKTLKLYLQLQTVYKILWFQIHFDFICLSADWSCFRTTTSVLLLPTVHHLMAFSRTLSHQLHRLPLKIGIRKALLFRFFLWKIGNHGFSNPWFRSSRFYSSWYPDRVPQPKWVGYRPLQIADCQGWTV